MLYLTEGVLHDGSLRLEPETMTWVPDASLKPGREISETEAVRWLQKESGTPLRPPVAVIGPREASDEERATARELGRWRLTGCTVYVTLEPCLMCAGLMVNARVDRCVYGAADPKGGAVGTLFDVSHDERLNHEFEVTSGVLADEAAGLLRAFFRARRR